MQPYLGLPWTDPHQIWTVDVFHHAPPIHGIQNAEMQIKSFLWRHHFCTLCLSTLANLTGSNYIYFFNAEKYHFNDKKRLLFKMDSVVKGKYNTEELNDLNRAFARNLKLPVICERVYIQNGLKLSKVG